MQSGRPSRAGAARRWPKGALPIGALLAALAAAACSSTSTKKSGSPEITEPNYLAVEARASAEQKPIGKYIADLDGAIRAWMDKAWTATTREDRQRHERLELYLEGQARLGKDELLIQLESGPLRNRIVAATALGFTRDPAMLSPLLSALEDESPNVVQNALVGLSLLGSADTPLDRVAELMRTSPDPGLRASAAYCARRLVEAGASGTGLLESARGGTVDTDPIARSQSALLLALLGDESGVAPLAMLLDDDVVLVVAAAARGLVHLGGEVPETRGAAARALAAALADADKQRREIFVRNLVGLSGRNYGKDTEAWREWAHRLP